MSETYLIGELTWQEFAARSAGTNTVLIPTGAVECYGPHLPMAADTIVAQAVAQRVAERTGALIAPALPVGDSKTLSTFPGTLCVRPESFKEYLRDILVSLRGWGFQNFLFINGHAGNVPMITQLSNEMQMAEPSLQFAQIDWWRYAQTYGKDIFEASGYMAHGHASECGTSVLQYLCPEMVRTDKIRCETPKVVNGKRFPAILRTTPFCEFSDAGMIGDATLATPEKGKKLVEKCVDAIVQYMELDFAKQG